MDSYVRIIGVIKFPINQNRSVYVSNAAAIKL